MALLLAKKLSLSLQFATPHLRLTLLPLLRLSTDVDQPKDLPFISQYLVSNFGFSPDRALRLAASPCLSPIKTPDRPEAVVRFLKETGLTDSQIKGLVSWNPQLFCCSVSNTLEPHVHKLVAGGFTGETLTRLICISPSVLLLKSAPLRLQFWRDYVGNNDVFLKIIRGNHRLLQYDIDDVVIPIINLLKDYGFSDVDIQRIYLELGRKLKSTDFAKKIIEETEGLGFNRESRMFVHGLIVVGKYNMDTIKRKFEFFRKNYGWSDEEVQTAFKRFPSLVGQSEKTLMSKIDFLLGTTSLKNQDIISNPELLGYSLEKRLMPRQDVLSLLKHKDLSKCASFSSVVRLSESRFLEKFVRPYKNEIPELGEIYAFSCQEKMSI